MRFTIAFLCAMLGAHLAIAATPAQINNARAKGIAYLIQTQQGDGSFIAAAGLETQSTGAAVEALANAGLKSSQTFSRATSWLLNSDPASIDAQARRIIALSIAGVVLTPLLDKLLPQKSQFDRASWGAYENFDSSFPDTPLVWNAIRVAGYTYPNYINELASAVLCEALPSQRADGGWPFTKTSATTPLSLTSSALLPTAYLLRELKAVRDTYFTGGTCGATYSIDTALTNGVTYLLSKKNADGGFGEGGVSGPLETALAYRAIQSINAAHAALGPAQDYLINTQQSNGAWGNALATGLVLNTFTATVLADSDRDGLPDVVEPILLTNASIPDSRSLVQGNGHSATGVTTARILPPASKGRAYSTSLGVFAGYTLVTGNLPPGLSLSTNGTVSGIPTVDGSYNFEYSASSGKELVQILVYAAAPVNYYDTAGAQMIYLAGSEATDAALGSAAQTMLQAGYYTYTSNASLPSGSYMAYLGYTTSGIPNVASGTKVLLIKRSKTFAKYGGAEWALYPMARNNPVAVLKIDSSCTQVSGNTYSCSEQGVDPGNVGYPAGGERVPDAVVTDVSPTLFKQPFNVHSNEEELQTLTLSGLTSIPVRMTMMGMVATNAVPDDAYFSNTLYGSILSAGIFSWDAVKRTTGGVVSVPAGNQIVICRRFMGSGAQAIYNQTFNSFPCTGGSLTSGISGYTTPARMTDSAGYGISSIGTGDGNTAINAIGVDVSAGYTVIENASASGVRACLKAANNGGVYLFQDEQNLWHRADFGSGGYGAIGLLSLDSQNKLSEGAESAWWFRSLDGASIYHYAIQTCTSGGALAGVCPTQQNLLQGYYRFADESTITYHTALVQPKKGVIEALGIRMSSPAYIPVTSAAIPLTTNNLTPTLDAAYNVTNSVARWLRFNACSLPFQLTF